VMLIVGLLVVRRSTDATGGVFRRITRDVSVR